MSTAKSLQLVVVTPETTLLDEPVQQLRFPLYDGQIGVLPGRAPLLGRLGYGELAMTTADGPRSYYIDGGFVQIQGPVVSLLTNRAVPADEISAEDAEEQLAKTRQLPTFSDVDLSIREREQERSRQMLALARKPR